MVATVILADVGESLVTQQGLVGLAISDFDVGQEPAEHTGQVQAYRARRHIVDARITVLLDLEVEEVEATRNEEGESNRLAGFEFRPVLAHEFVETGVRDNDRVGWNACFAARTACIVLLEHARTVCGAPQALGVAAARIDEGELRFLAHRAVGELLAGKSRAVCAAAIRHDAGLADLAKSAHQMRLDVDQLAALPITRIAGEAQIFGV